MFMSMISMNLIMKKIYKVLSNFGTWPGAASTFLICFISVTCFASKNQEAFLNANKLCKQKKYKEALVLYKSIEKKGYATLFNMGNCAFCSENYVNAILYWSRAKKSAPFSKYEDINYNISVAHDRLEITQKITFWDEVYDLLNLFSMFSLQILFLFFWFAFFISFMWIKRLRVFILFSVPFFVFVFSTALFLKYRARSFPTALVKSAILVFSGPNENYHEVAKLSVAKADKVIVQKIHKNWYKIKSDGVTGWVLSDGVEII